MPNPKGINQYSKGGKGGKKKKGTYKMPTKTFSTSRVLGIRRKTVR